MSRDERRTYLILILLALAVGVAFVAAEAGPRFLARRRAAARAGL